MLCFILNLFDFLIKFVTRSGVKIVIFSVTEYPNTFLSKFTELKKLIWLWVAHSTWQCPKNTCGYLRISAGFTWAVFVGYSLCRWLDLADINEKKIAFRGVSFYFHRILQKGFELCILDIFVLIILSWFIRITLKSDSRA